MQTRIVSLLALALTTLPGPAAAQEPRPGVSDPRLKWVVYNEREVIEVLGHYGFQTLVQFGPAEEVTDVSLGDGLAWQVDIPARKNLLFLKPVEDYAATNLTVLTTRPALDGSGELTRVYVFSLVATVPQVDGQPLFTSDPVHSLCPFCHRPVLLSAEKRKKIFPGSHPPLGPGKIERMARERLPHMAAD